MIIIITAAKIIALITLSVVGAVFSGLGLSELTTNGDESIKDNSESPSINLLVTEEAERIEPFTPVSNVDESIKDNSESPSKNLFVTEEAGRIEPFTPVSKVTLDSST